jgi:cell wall-associated NlpC family hydrolase
VDCSGLLVASYKKYGVYLPHSSKILMSYGKSVKNNYKYWKPGDIMARDGHARMYVGNGCVIQTMSGIGVWVTSGWTEVEDNYVVRRTP